jgi:serine/threonine protein kinase
VLPFDAVARIGAQVASALAAAHRLGIIHRDVKPGNVLIAENGTARISDFGISHALGDVTLTSTGMVHGTPAYLAPEVARGSDSSFSSDVFGLGATLYTAVEGAPPFGTNQNSIALLYKVASGEFDPPNPEGPLSPLLLRMLAPDPADRPAMGDVVLALDAATGRGASAIDLGGPTKVLPSASGSPNQGPVPPAYAEPGQPTARTVPAAPVPPSSADPSPPLVAREEDAVGAQGPPPDDDHPWSTSSDPHEPSGSRPGRTVARVALALALVAGLAVLVVNVLPMLRSGNGDPREGALPGTPSTSVSAQPSTSTSQRPNPSATPSDTPAPTPAATSATSTSSRPSPTPTPRPTPSASTTSDDDTPTARQLGQAISSYYGLVPGDTDAGWSRLTRSYQSANAGSRNSYERFWGSIDRATVSDAEGDPPDEAEATVTYFFKDGRVVRERTAYGLVDDDGVLKINSSRVISSSTTRG